MSMTAEREALIKQHNKLKSELDDIKIEMDRLERANEHLRRQNINMRQMIEGQQNAENISANRYSTNSSEITNFSATAMSKSPESQRPQPLLSSFSLPKADFIMDTLSQASAFGDAATGELFKQACNIADDFVKKLQLSERPTYPDYDNIFQQIVKEAGTHDDVCMSLSCDESCIDSATESAASDRASSWPEEASKIVHIGYVKEATGSGNDNRTARSAPPGGM